MNRYMNFIIKYRKLVVVLFLAATVLCIGLSTKVCNKCSRRNLTVGGIHGLCHLHFTSVCRESTGRRKGAGCHGGFCQTVSGKCTFQWIDDSQWICGIDSDAVSDRSGYGMGDGKGNCPQPVFRIVFPSGTDHDFL